VRETYPFRRPTPPSFPINSLLRCLPVYRIYLQSFVCDLIASGGADVQKRYPGKVPSINLLGARLAPNAENRTFAPPFSQPPIYASYFTSSVVFFSPDARPVCPSRESSNFTPRRGVPAFSGFPHQLAVFYANRRATVSVSPPSYPMRKTLKSPFFFFVEA